MGCQLMGFQTFRAHYGVGPDVTHVEIPRSHSHAQISERRLWLRSLREHKGFWATVTNHQLLAEIGMRDFDLRFPWATGLARDHHRRDLTRDIPRTDVFLFTDANTAFKFKMRWA